MIKKRPIDNIANINNRKPNKFSFMESYAKYFNIIEMWPAFFIIII